MSRITNYLTGAFLLFLFLSCANDGNNEIEKKDSFNQLKEELRFDKFSNANIAKNVEVNWKNVLKTEKKDLKILEIDTKEKFSSKLESNFLQAEVNYQLISIESKGELKNYFIEVFSYNDSDAYSKTITKLNKFKGILNVFLLNGQNIGSIAIEYGSAKNISKSNTLDFLTETINSFYVPSNITKKIPLCDGTYTQVVEQSEDRWRVVSVGGKILSVEYMDTKVTRTTTILPYPCDGSGDRDAIILQRTAHYYTSDGKSYSGVSNLLETIITDSSFSNNPCLVAVFTKLGGSPTFQTYLKRFDGNFSVANLKLSVSSILASNVNAETTSPINYLINIRFNENKLNRPALSIARTFIHEMIHAETYRKLLSIAGQPQIQFNVDQLNQLKNDYPGLYDYYMRYEFNIPPGQTPSDAQHEAMATHYRDIIVQTMKQFDNTLTNETYEALAWEGLKNTVAWKKLSVEKQNNILAIISNFNNKNSNCQ